MLCPDKITNSPDKETGQNLLGDNAEWRIISTC